MCYRGGLIEQFLPFSLLIQIHAEFYFNEVERHHVSARRSGNARSVDQSSLDGQRGIGFISRRSLHGCGLSVFDLGRSEPVLPGYLDECFEKFHDAGQAGSDQRQYRNRANFSERRAGRSDDSFAPDDRDGLEKIPAHNTNIRVMRRDFLKTDYGFILFSWRWSCARPALKPVP